MVMKYMSGDRVYVISEDEEADIVWDDEASMFIIQFVYGWLSDFDHYFGKEMEVLRKTCEDKQLIKTFDVIK